MKQVTELKYLQLLNLSSHEAKLFALLQSDMPLTPLELSRKCAIPRASIYVALSGLKKRGLARHVIINKKSKWCRTSESELTNILYETKKKLLGFVDGKEEVVSGASSATDGVVTVHRGNTAVKKVIFDMIRDRKHERFLGYTAFSDVLMKGWMNVFTEDEINEFNRIVKKNGIISELIAPENWIEDHYKAMGNTWAKDYEGRTSSAVYLDKKYFQNSGQIFAFKDVMYLVALNDKMVIEIRHSDIQKMILGMYSFIKERGETVDVNKRLRELMKKGHEKEGEEGDIKTDD